MYFQITTRCNMSCAHCCYSCTFEGEDMPWETFKLAMDRYGKMSSSFKRSISIGGGEPTLHPDFWKIINYAMLYGKPWFATNGSNTEDVLRASDMAKKGLIRSCLSIDKYHSKIDKKVINSFKDGLTRYPMSRSPKKSIRNKTCSWEWHSSKGINVDGRSIRVSRNVKKIGRSKEGVVSCCCPTIQVKPNGTMTGCGCPDAPVVGTVKDGFFKEFEDKLPILRKKNNKRKTGRDIFWCSTRKY